jgi:hypothetical protein
VSTKNSGIEGKLSIGNFDGNRFSLGGFSRFWLTFFTPPEGG